MYFRRFFFMDYHDLYTDDHIPAKKFHNFHRDWHFLMLFLSLTGWNQICTWDFHESFQTKLFMCRPFLHKSKQFIAS
jgi:hypothetical protein